MLFRLWRRLGGVPVRSATSSTFRPTLDALDDRLLPSVLFGNGEAGVAQVRQPHRAAETYRTTVTVNQNAPPTLLNVVDILKGLGVQDAGDRSLYVINNTNPGLVRPRLADEELTLTYTANQTGKAEITIDAIDAAGESVRLIIEVTVSAPRE